MSAADELGISGPATSSAPVQTGAAGDLGIGATPAVQVTPPAVGFGSGGFGGVTKTLQKDGKNVAKTVGRAIVSGHQHPFTDFLNVMTAPQRGLQALETTGGSNNGTVSALIPGSNSGMTASIFDAMMNPKQGPVLTQAVNDKIGLTALDNGPMAGTDLPHKLGRGAIHTAVDMANDPMTFAPVGKITEGVGKLVKAIPGVVPAADAVGKFVGSTPVGQAGAAIGDKLSSLFNPDHYLNGLTPDAKAQFEGVTNRSMEVVRQQKAVEDAIVAKHADEIRRGIMPDEVAGLFTNVKRDPLPAMASPGAPIDALNLPVPTSAKSLGGLRTGGDINARPSGVARGNAVNSSKTDSLGQGAGGQMTQRPSGVARGASVTPRNVPPLMLPPTIRPGAPLDALNQTVDSRFVPQASSIKPNFTDTMSRSQPGGSTMTAWQTALTDPKTGELNFGPGTRPQDIQKALFTNRAPNFKTQAMPELEKYGFFTSPSAIDAGRSMGKPDVFSAPLNEIPGVQDRLMTTLDSKFAPEATNPILRAGRYLTQRGNQAFLANPIPHTLNLTDLAYNKYGAPTALQGLGNAARVATGTVGNGKLASNIAELESLGAKSQYGNIFDELGLTRLAGIPGTEGAASLVNKALVPAQKASNFMQNKILNSTETGLRAAALEAEKAGGTTGDQAAKSIHASFGTDAPNAVSAGLSQLAVPFAKFHTQTAVQSVGNTLMNNPARVSNTVKANRDFNQQVNPVGPQYRNSVPGMSAARMLSDPISYFSGLGPLGDIANIKDQALKGGPGLQALAGGMLQKFTPGSQQAAALQELINSKKNPRSRATGTQDAIDSLIGGYYGKK